MRSCNNRYLCVAAIGVGVAVALKARAIPKLLARAKTEMMRKMMAQMGEGCCGPSMSSGCGGWHGREESDEQPASTASSRCGCGATPTAEEATEAALV